LSNQCPRLARRRASLYEWRARLPALTLAALATGYYPDGSASEPGFPRRLTGVCLLAKETAVKHAPCGPVLVPVDRGSEAARVRRGRAPARGHRITLASFGVTGDVPYDERDGAVMVIATAKSNTVRFSSMNQHIRRQWFSPKARALA